MFFIQVSGRILKRSLALSLEIAAFTLTYLFQLQHHLHNITAGVLHNSFHLLSANQICFRTVLTHVEKYKNQGSIFLFMLHFDSIIDALFFASGLPCNQQRILEQHEGEGCANLNVFSHCQLIYILFFYIYIYIYIWQTCFHHLRLQLKGKQAQTCTN